MSILTDIVGSDGIKTDVTVKLDNATVINFGLAIFLSVIASFYVIKLIGKLSGN